MQTYRTMVSIDTLVGDRCKPRWVRTSTRLEVEKSRCSGQNHQTADIARRFSADLAIAVAFATTLLGRCSRSFGHLHVRWTCA